MNTPPPTRLTIADVAFTLASEVPLLPSSWEPVYAEFLNGAPAAAAWPVQVTVRRGMPAGLEAARRIFDGQLAWSALADGDARFFVHAPEALADAPWAARLASDHRTLEIGCGRTLVHRQSDGTDALACPLRYPLDQVLLMYLLAARGGLLLHAAGVLIGGALYLLAGRSGAGKSTLSRLTRAAGVGTVLSDDRIVVRAQAGGWRGHGTPWPGTERIARAGSGAVAGILLIEHGATNQPERLAPAAAVKALLPLASILWHEPALIGPMTDTAAQLAAAVPVYRLPFTPDARAVAAVLRVAGD